MPTSAFRKQEINVAPGLQVDIDGMIGTIRTVTGGRVIVDFNHPFAGKELIYDIKVKRHVTDPEEQVKGLIKVLLSETPETKLADGAMEVTLKTPLPEEALKVLEQKILELVKLKSVTFKAKPAEEKAVAGPKSQ